ncbi:MAG: hypothetical protein LBB56_01530, partial [Chitinispirillales bacterium]|nr:hypothetical protein [Chitinispirillales bacterium]
MLLLASASNVFSRQEINIQVIGASAFVRDTVRLADDKLFINAAGSGIRDTSDNCVFAYANSFGDFEFQAGVSLEGLVNKGEAGLMVREQTTPASPFLAIVNTAGGCYILYRSVQAGLVGAARISTTSIPFLKIKRTGGNFFFYYKSEESASFTVWPAAYKMNISPSVYIGFVAASNSNNSSAAVFDGISGLPSEKNTYNKNTCEARLIDFNSADNMASAGLDAFSFWELDSGFIYSTTPGGTVSSDAGLMNFTAARGDSPLSFSWKMYVDSDDAPQLSDYVLFGSEGLHIGHRVYTAGRHIGSGG